METQNTKSEPAPDFMTFMRLLWPGALTVQAIYTVARLEIADHLATGPKSLGELHASTSANKKTLERLLQALTSIGMFSKDDGGKFQNTALSELLRKDHPGSMRPWALMLGASFVWKPMGELHDAVVTGTASFNQIFSTHFFDYLASHPEDAEIFNRAMAAQSTNFMEELARFYDFSRFSNLVDLGGGTGENLARILETNSTLKGVLFDLPEVIEQVKSSLVTRFNGRLTLASGNFFDTVPGHQDCYMMVRVIHDWADEDAVKILQKCREAMDSGTTLLLVETILDQRSESPQAMMDMLMLVLLGSMERSEENFRELLQKGGFEIIRVIKEPGFSMIESRPVPLSGSA